ncbi:hypothetical protein IA69_21420 [Massilia sp. JS1662]|nr:DUF1176 domain-containing protein [Massilia sp. JS1662]KGF79981.1 hypothetical protein IA69_21420 [Massilia sp. JS1662]
MPKQRYLICLLLAANVAAASTTFSHKDWELACDNTRTCRAAGYHEEDDGPNATILLTRAAGPNQPVKVELQLADDERHPAPDQLAMSIDGRALGIVRNDVKTSILTLTDTQVRALLPALQKNGRIAWTGKGTTWTVSTAGANAVLLNMDEFQGRLDTPGALVRKGSKPESNVLSPLPAPEIQAGPVSQEKNPVKLTAAQTRELKAALRKTVEEGDCELLDSTSATAGELEVRAFTKDKLLVSHTCWIAAYNTGDGYWIVDAKPPYSAVLVTTSATDYDEGVITSFQKGRGIGDCIASATWTWDGRAFAKTSDTTTGMCRQITPGGAWDLPTLVTKVRKSR